MLRRSQTRKVECRFGGEHAVSSARMRIVSERLSHYAHSTLLTRDAEAQHWLGWGPHDAPPARVLVGRDPLLLSKESLPFVGIDATTGRLVASVTVTLSAGGYRVGGMVDPDFRGRGYGREMLDAVCFLAHQHFGIAQLVAGCEATNVASQRWLVSCQFVRVAGPPRHVLPNGREVEHHSWQRLDPTAKRRCRNLPL